MTNKTENIIDEIGKLCLFLNKRSLKTKVAVKAIRRLQGHEEISNVLGKLCYTEEDMANRKVISDIVSKIKKGQIKIKL